MKRAPALRADTHFFFRAHLCTLKMRYASENVHTHNELYLE